MLAPGISELRKHNKQEKIDLWPWLSQCANKIPPIFFSWTCLRALRFLCEVVVVVVGFFQWDFWRKFCGLENGTRTLFVDGSSQRNMTRQRDPNFLFSFTVIHPTRGFKICFPLVGMSLSYVFTLTANVLIILVGFIRNFNIFYGQTCQKPTNGYCMLAWYWITVFFTRWSEYPWITTWPAFLGRDSLKATFWYKPHLNRTSGWGDRTSLWRSKTM